MMHDENITTYPHTISQRVISETIFKWQVITLQVLAVSYNHLNPCMKPAIKPVATRTVFTTQIWDVTGITQPRLKTAEKQLRA